MKTLARIFVFVFCTGLVVLALIFRSGFSKQADQRDLALIKMLPPQYVASDILNPQKAKSNHFLWVNRPLPAGGAALKVLENPELFSQIFPGYPDSMRTDQSLWDIFFNQDMFVLDWLLLPMPIPGLFVSHSNFGGVEIFQRYGADILIFGNSEAESISPEILSGELSGSPKILGVEVPASTLKVTREVAERMALSGKKSDWAILGVPLSNLFRHSASTRKMEKRILSRFSFYEHQSDHSLLRFIDLTHEIKLEKYLSQNSLDDFLPSRGGRKSNNGRTFPASWLKPEQDLTERLEKTSSQWKIQSDIFNSIDESDCQMEWANEELDLTLKSILKVSNRVIVILTPASSLELRQLPGCFPIAAQNLLQSKMSANVLLSTVPGPSFGITIADYISTSEKGELAYLDQNHLNSEGARIFTKFVARFLKEKEERR